MPFLVIVYPILHVCMCVFSFGSVYLVLVVCMLLYAHTHTDPQNKCRKYIGHLRKVLLIEMNGAATGY